MKSTLIAWIVFIWSWIKLIFRLLLKRLLRISTSLCELQRICYSTEKGAERTLQIEKSLQRSRSKVILRIRNTMEAIADKPGVFTANNAADIAQIVELAVEAICVDKSINAKLHDEYATYLQHQTFLTSIRTCFLQIYGYRQLQAQVAQLKSTSYDSSNEQHERKLLQLWMNLMPDTPIENRISKLWMEIGFQGTDPKTDFRGMGMLGLENLLYLSSKYNSIARHILSHSNHPVHGYPFAITGINITHMAYTLLNSGKLKTHFYNTYFSTMCIEDFHKVYCYLFFHFDKHWLKQKPKDVMEFRYIKESFLTDLNEKLQDLSESLNWDPSIHVI